MEPVLILVVGYDDKCGTLKSCLSGRGRSMFAQLNAELHFGFRQCGSVVLAFNEEGVYVFYLYLMRIAIQGNFEAIIREWDQEWCSYGDTRP